MSTTPQEHSSSALAKFELRQGPRAGQEIPIRSPVVTIGQGPQNDLVLNDDSVSTTHARLEYEAGGWRLTDLGSTNGTYLEDVRLAPDVSTPVAYGSGIRFGGVSLWFNAVPAADPEGARARWTPPPPATTLAERRPPFRLPLWILLVVLLLIGLAALLFLLGGEPEAAGALLPSDVPLALSGLHAAGS